MYVFIGVFCGVFFKFIYLLREREREQERERERENPKQGAQTHERYDRDLSQNQESDT